jgi:hypothetical protein
MKTLKKTINTNETKYLRVKDGDTNGYIRQGYSFCPKSEWKKNVRDFNKETNEERKERKSKKNS